MALPIDLGLSVVAALIYFLLQGLKTGAFLVLILDLSLSLLLKILCWLVVFSRWKKVRLPVGDLERRGMLQKINVLRITL